MGQSDSLAYGGRTERLARQQYLQQEFAIDLLRQWHDVDHRVKDLGLIAAADAIVDSPLRKRLAESDCGGPILRLDEDRRGNIHPL